MMNDSHTVDEKRLIDYLMGRCDEQQARRLRRRLGTDAALRRRHDALVNTFAALRRLPDADPPDDLVERTLTRIARRRQTDALVARHEKRPAPIRAIFTLRELGALAAAAVLIAAVTIPSIIEADRVADAKRCKAQMGDLARAIQASALDHNGALPAAPFDARKAEPDRLRWLPNGDDAVFSNSAALFQLVRNYGVSPAPFVVRAGMSDFPAAEYVSYSYQHSVGAHRLNQNDPRLAGVAEHMAILADGTPLFDGGRFLPERLDARAGDNHDGRGQNVLYLDMHAEWTERPDAGVDADNIYLAGQIRNYTGTESPTSPQDTFLLPTYTPSR
jgi:hypothetical protein